MRMRLQRKESIEMNGTQIYADGRRYEKPYQDVEKLPFAVFRRKDNISP
jgi:hypothetical protein